MIAAVTGSVELEQAKERYREEGGKINMCEAIHGMIEDGRKEGLMEGMSKGLTEGNMEGQRKKAYQAAKNMYARGFSIEDTSSLLEESPEVVAEWFASWKKE